MTFPEKIAQLRKEKHLSQEQLAEVLSVSRQAITKWESGESTPEISNLIGLSRFFSVSIDALVKDTERCASEAPASREPEENWKGFLCRAKKATYAGGANETTSSRPYSHDFFYEEGVFQYRDSYLGGEFFSGEEAMWERGIPLWAMNYSGRVLHPDFSGDFLKAALTKAPPELPLRGPAIYREHNNTYRCDVTGAFGWFQGYETIFSGDSQVYECHFHGGTVK